jgi:hypothetical protein
MNFYAFVFVTWEEKLKGFSPLIKNRWNLIFNLSNLIFLFNIWSIFFDNLLERKIALAISLLARTLLATRRKLLMKEKYFHFEEREWTIDWEFEQTLIEWWTFLWEHLLHRTWWNRLKMKRTFWIFFIQKTNLKL